MDKTMTISEVTVSHVMFSVWPPTCSSLRTSVWESRSSSALRSPPASCSPRWGWTWRPGTSRDGSRRATSHSTSRRSRLWGSVWPSLSVLQINIDSNRSLYCSLVNVYIKVFFDRHLDILYFNFQKTRQVFLEHLNQRGRPWLKCLVIYISHKQ